ncbi:MAG TPA: helix-turn-helix transcriptional regulator [Trebonia sp.]
MGGGTNRLGEFLRAKRALAQPSGIGILDPHRRRVQGLRREEVAALAGVSTDYYIRLEQGRDRHPSPAVLAALGEVLGLDDDALAHLRQLAAPDRPRRRAAVKPEQVAPGLLRLLNIWSDTPAFVQNRFRDVLACSVLAAALHPGLARERNMVRLLFLDPAEQDMYPDWDRAARDSVAWLRAATGADPDHPRLSELVGGLALKSEPFARLWARHDVRTKSAGIKRLVHPVVGEVSLEYETFSINASSGQSLTVYHAEPGSRDADTLALLASHTVSVAAGRDGDALGGVTVFGGWPAASLLPVPSRPSSAGSSGPAGRSESR